MKQNKYATIENVTKLLKHYQKFDLVCKGKEYDDISSILEDNYISDGICYAFTKIILKCNPSDVNEMIEGTFTKEFKIKPDDFNWVTPDRYWLLNKNPLKGLKPRIRHLEKLLHNLQTSTNNSK